MNSGNNSSLNCVSGAATFLSAASITSIVYLQRMAENENSGFGSGLEQLQSDLHVLEESLPPDSLTWVNADDDVE